MGSPNVRVDVISYHENVGYRAILGDEYDSNLFVVRG
jgi:hypothetical protein